MSSRLSRITGAEWRERALEARGCVSTLAQSCAVSPRQLERFFRERWGVCPIEWLNEIRLQAAPAMIRNGKTVKEAASALGYEDASHFTKEFKAFHGCLPSEARENGNGL